MLDSYWDWMFVLKCRLDFDEVQWVNLGETPQMSRSSLSCQESAMIQPSVSPAENTLLDVSQKLRLHAAVAMLAQDHRIRSLSGGG